MKQGIKLLIPSPLVSPVREVYLSLRRLPDLPQAYLHPWRRKSIAALSAFHNKYAGQRAFIIGNGPSLRDTDLTKLRNDFTFGLNRIYLNFQAMGFPTSCLVSVNDLVIQQCVYEMQALAIPRFLAWRSHTRLAASTPLSELPAFLYTTYESPRFSRDVRGRVWEGATVTYVAMQLAFHMGFSRVVLIGVDHNFASKGEANKTVVSEGEDRNHFSPEYFGKGFRWQLPDLATSELAYGMAREAYERAGRELIDATVGGKLQVLPKVDYNSLFK